MSTRYRLTITILLAALLGGVDAQAGVTVKGSVFGGGNQADVQVNTSVNISAGSVEGNVYGGGNLGDVGTHADQNPASTGNYVWKDQDGNAIYANTADNKMTGVCNVTISGGTIGLVSTDKPKEHGNVFGGGKGSATTFECEKGMVYNTNVSINTSASVKGNVYGGGEVSRVENNTDVTIGTASGEDVPIIEGSVFGAGAGINTHGYSALVRGTSTVTVQGSAQVKKNVYGGGELASVGRYKVKTPANEENDDVPATLPYGMPARLIDGGKSTVTIQDNAVIGTDGVTTTGHVYGAGQGLVPRLDYDYVTQEQFEGDDYIEDDHKPKRMISGNNWEYFATKSAYLQFVETLALSAETDVTITGSATVKGSVFGGSENGFVYHDTDVKIQDGSTVNGSAFGGGRGISSFAEAGRVKGNTGITISGGAVHGNVYGGGNLGDVGTINKSDANYNYVWKNSTVNGNINAEGNGNTAQNNDITGTNTNTGICTVTISGGTIGTGVSANADGTYSNGNVFGAGKGLDDTWWCEKAMVFATNVNITAGTVRGTVYGGGEIGRVEDDVKVTIGEGESAPAITGNVFGAGAGKHTHGYSALVRGNSLVTIKSNSTVGGSVYGGGEIASVGRFNVVGGLPKDPLSGGTCTVIIDDNAAITGDVFGACKGVNPSGIAQADRKSMQLLANAPSEPGLWSHYNNDENSLFIWRTYATDADYLAFLETLALTSNTEVTISGNATVNESVYGGGQRGITLGSVTVNMTGGTVVNDIYGGGALANTNKGNWDFTNDAWADGTEKSALYTTKVVLTGGSAKNVYGGALGDVDNQAKVYGDIAVYLNGIEDADYNSTDHASLSAAIGSDHMLPQDATGAVVDKIFGANNLYGTPLGHVKVHVFATQTAGANKKIAEADKYSLFEDISNYTITDYTDLTTLATAVGADVDTYTDILTDDNATTLQKEAALADMIDAIAKKKYDVQAVYGGGNLSAYEPIESNERTEIIIDGCHYTSIRQVYGGGNAASVPASYVRVNGTYEIHEVFGGGNGNDPYVLDNKYYNNPGANVGYYNYTHWDDQTGADLAHAYNPIDNTTPDYPDATTKEARMANYRYGSGIATSEIYGGLIHSVYGGSNQKGNISTTAISIYDDMDDNCPVTVDETYGGGKNAPMDGEIELSLDCVKNMPMIFGGAKNADVNSDVTLNITNGTFQKVFGGNNMGGAINGSITVNIKEEGCQPIIIGELYGGGYFADYSVYGYNADKTVKHDDGVDDDQDIPLYKDPRINVISASKIGAIYGGGYKAVVVGNPHINVNMEAGIVKDVASNYASGQDYTVSEVVEITENESTTYNAILAIGSIGNIYGGGNLADIEGDTHVEIGTGTWHNANGELETISPARNAANITGNVFGGGQGDSNPATAMVTGNTNINFGNGSIAKSIYGGGKLAQVGGDASVTVSGGTIGTNNLGGAEYGNIYGGGFGSTDGVLFGLIKGNTYVTVSNGTILHNIYGGGAYGSVGTFTYDNNNVITGHTANTGTANVYITGGTIGTDGKENGMVFGSSRGDVGEPDGIHDRLAWVYDTKVTIGDTTANATITTTTPLIKGSIYGGGENGHNYNDAYVRINGGTIGINNNEDVTYHDDPTDNTLVTYSGKDYNYPYRGNVYGGGCGTDQYDSDDDNINDSYNPKAGIVLNNARVNITGGHIIRNVYGAGAMGSVGTITNDINEKDANDKYIYRHDQTKTESYIYPYSETYQGAFYNFGLSWPVELVYPTTSGQDAHTYTGKTTVTITGSTTTIGVSNSDATGGDVYGAARGEAGDRFKMAGFANVREASVTIGTIGQDGPDIKGSVFGGSANGHVYEDASVVINSGTIAHSVYGGGNGNGTYKSTLWKPKSSDPDDITRHDETEIQDIYSFNAGKVYGNTNVTINGGTVKRNVYGGGNLGSVGKGNYSGGTDDYSTVGYGELPAKDNDQETALWTNSLFTNSGLATVIINSGTIGESGVNYDGLPTGNVFGSSRGKAALNVGQRSPRYKYVPDFFLGYTNETAVIIGSDDENYSGTNPIIYGSVYGGGQDGHVRRGTNVTVNKGTIGMASEGGLDRGNVFGAGSGIGTYTDVYDNDIPKCSNSSGSVTGTTTVDIKGGTIYQNVYGGGALASVGPPWAGQGAPSNNYDERKVATGTSASYSYTQVNIGGGNISGSVYGASRGPSQSLIDDVFTVNSINTYDAKSFATVIWADVNVTGNAGIAGSVFGGGEKGIVKHATEVNIGTTGNNGTYTGTISQNVYGGGKEAIVGGNVTVNINSGTITHNVYGGGDQANTNTNSVKINDVNETGAYNTADEPANGVSTVVTMSGATAATVYGGGNLADVIGNVTVNIEGGTLNGSSIGSVTGAVFGGGFGETTKVTGNVEVNIGTTTTSGEPPTASYGGNAQIAGDVYGGSAKGKVNTSDGTNATENTTTSVNLYGGNITGNIYGGGLGDNTPSEEIAANVYGPVTVTVEGGSATNVYGCNNLYGSPQSTVAVNINGTATPTPPATYAIGNVYGGGNLAAYGGSPTVSMSGGYVSNIFGGGNLADVAGSVTVTVSGGNVINDVYGGGALANTNTANWDFTYETWAGGIIDETTGATTYNTTLNLTGGIIGNAYGGALGRLAQDAISAIPAMVYGDVTVTVDGAALPAVLDRVELDADNKPINILKGGRVFGCNNINGTPKGKVQVIVTQTNNSNPTKQDKPLSRTTITDRYHYYYDDGDQIDVAAVYGGGNASDYEPVTNQAPKVIIDGCNDVSIGSVYGGGNAAAVPATDVVIEGSYYIGYVFGGGFGAGSDNRGANVGYKSFPLDNPPTGNDRTPYLYGSGQEIGNALVTVKGGYIDNVFGGSDTKGDISGTVASNISEVSNGCDLKIGSLYGGGRRATVDHDITTQIDCPSNSISAVYGGSEMADIHGNVTLTITAGTFDEVFGGNRKSGVIDGYITVNLEETSIGCRPIRITSLYGGCDDAPYSGAANSDGYNVTVNAKAFTSIGSLFGGSKGANAILTGNTLVNVNQTLGYWAGKHYPLQVPGEGGQNVDNTNPADLIPNQLGTIGTIYGGGDQAKVIGNTVVNIGTETTVGFINEPTHLREDPEVALTKTDNLYYVPVLGANITGDVYGGGNLADVTENTYVKIGARNVTVNDTEEWQSVAVGTEGLTIGGNVFGGGKGAADNFTCDKAMVGDLDQGVDITGEGEDAVYTLRPGGTNVRIGNGTIVGNVYGGGEIARVERNTQVTIGLPAGQGGTSAPVVKGSVFAAGAGVPTHGYSALTRGTSTVTVQEQAKIWNNVYGGGELASVGRYWVASTPALATAHNVSVGMPYGLKAGGTSTVVIQGNATIGNDDIANSGNVFGAGMGIEPLDYDYASGEDGVSGYSLDDHKPKRMMNYVAYDSETGKGHNPDDQNKTWKYYVDEEGHEDQRYVWEYFANRTDYLKFIETLALSAETDVTIKESATVKGSVYGGSQKGFVYRNTDVKIQNGTIENDVYGGGLGLASYSKAGQVGGNTYVTISNGAINRNVYGGGKLGPVGTFVVSDDMRNFYWTNNLLINIDPADATTFPYNNTGVCNVTISGGTIGISGVTMNSEGSFANGNVFGSGKGLDDTFWCEKGIAYSTNIYIMGGTVNGNVYGGGEIGRVETNSTVNIGDDENENSSPAIVGNVFGGGAGVKTHGYSGLIRGNTYVTVQSSATVGHNVYGGGQIAAVGKYYLNAAGMPYSLVSDALGISNVTIKGNATITGNVFGAGKGKEPENYTYADNANRPKRMMSYNTALYTESNHSIWEFADANEKYVWEYFDTKPKYQTFLETLGLSTQAFATIGGTRNESTGVVTASGSPVISGSVYGGSESGFVQHHTSVTIAGGTIGTTTTGGDVFGGGLGTLSFAEAGRVRGNTTVNIQGGAVNGNVYGGGSLGDVGTITKSADYNYTWKQDDGNTANSINNNNITGTNDNTGICTVNVSGGVIGIDNPSDATKHGNVFGASRGSSTTWWCEKAIVYATNVNVSKGTVKGNVYGGGEVGRVEDDAKITIGTSGGADYLNITGSIFGAGAGLATHGYSALVRGNSDITVQGKAQVGGSVYGGGEIASVGRFKVVGGLPSKPQAGGNCTVTIQDDAKIGSSGTEHNVFGACKGVTPAWNNTLNDVNRSKSMQLYNNRPKDAQGNEKEIHTYWDYYEPNHDFVWVYYATEADYLNFLQTLALTSNTKVTIDGNSEVYGSVYGGGERGITLGSVNVNMLSGTVHQDIYGGGSLANSNVAMWDAANQMLYDYVPLELIPGLSHVTGYYTKSGNDYTLTSNDIAGEGEANSYYAQYKTNVNLLGGIIGGNAYGGGLGDLATLGTGHSNVEAKVYGDVKVNLNGLEKADYSNFHAKYPTFTLAHVDGDNSDYMIPNSGQKGAIVNKIFGCNNLNGTPMAHVKVHVFATQNANTNTIAQADKYGHPVQGEKGYENETMAEYLTRLAAFYPSSSPASNTAALLISAAQTANTAYNDASESEKEQKLTALNNAIAAMNTELNKFYDMEAVYGGGNLAKYEPADPTPSTSYNDTEEFTEVIIDGCHYTSIKQVYGGGNAAPAAATYVCVNGTYEIDEVFGGGNGADSYTMKENGIDIWHENPGANVGYRNYTHWESSTSVDSPGTAENPYHLAVNNTTSEQGGDASTADLRRTNYGYGTGVATTDIRGGTIHYVFGGSNKKGNISTTALSVYSEADDGCLITIHESYGGGKDAPIDGEINVTLDCVKEMDMIFGGSKNADVNNNITLNITNGYFKKVFGGNNTSGAINGSITVNIEEKGCVPIQIDELYGGGYLAPYSIYGYEKYPDGSYKTESVSYVDDDNVVRYLDQRIPLTSGVTHKNDPRINIISASRIGTVYGGGYQAKMVGSPHVNVNMTNGIVDVKNTAEPGNPAVYKDGGGTPYTIVAEKTVEVTKVEKGTDDPDTYAFTEGEQPNQVTYVYKDAEGTIYDPAKVVTENNRLYAGIGEFYATLNIGTIDSIYGGGNLADIVGNTYVEIGTGKWISWDDQGNPIWETEDASGNKYKSSQTSNAVTYSQAECNAYNKNLKGYIASTKVLTSAQATAINTKLGTSYNENDVIYVEDAAAYNATLEGLRKTTDVKTPAVYYTQAECDEYNSAHNLSIGDAGYRKTTDIKTPAVYYTQAECSAYNAENITDYIACTATLEAKKAVAVNEAIGANYAAGATIYTEDAAAFNATLNGYLTTADVKTPAEWTWYNVTAPTVAVEEPTPARNAANITGDVYGGGKGLADNFTCNKAMVGVDGDGVNNPDGGTNVTIANGTIGGSVYGGGKIARVEKNTVVTIGLGDGVDETTSTPTSAPVINGNVFGAGKGVETHGYSALVRGNPTVIIQGNAKVEGSVFGGGEIASVARYKVVNGSPVALANKTSGNCKVIIRGYAEVGPDNMKMYHVDGNNNIVENDKPDDTGHVFGAGKGILPKIYSYEDNAHKPRRMLAKGTPLTSGYSTSEEYDANNIWEYFGNDEDYHKFIETLALSSKTDVTITDHAFVKGSVYGGSQNGIVQYNTHVTIDGDCQIGAGEGVNSRYTPEEWAYDGSDNAHSLRECAHWDYDITSGAPYDPFAKATGQYDYNESNYSSIPDSKKRSSTAGGMAIAKDGHTYYGNVFGGGSGVEPYAPGLWHRAAGVVRGNTVVDITGGHILTSVYGGNEHTDVGIYDNDSYNEPTIPVSGGLCTVNFGGTATLGVPRTLAQIAAHPVTCYLFGAGKGDTRTFFNTWTNIREAEVNITGGKIFGSVFGGGEDGHVLENITVNINEHDYTTNNTNTRTLIGTTGTSYVDGNVFGAGRGFTGEALTAGSVGGNVEVNISGGTMLGSIYGGGRLASVGIGFNAPTNSNYGQFTQDGNGKSYGHVTVNISGGTIGNDIEDITVEHTKGGNVFGGSMGRLTLLDESYNELWPQLAQVKTANVNISGNNTIIKGSVYGGSELGTVRDSTNVVVGKESLTSETITRPTIYRNVFGGGYGSRINSDDSKAIIESKDVNNNTIFFGYTPMQWSGLVGINTRVNIYNGWIKKCIYGGGEMASVGIINYILDDTQYDTENDVPAGKLIFRFDPETSKYVVYKNIVKHVDEEKSFALSWPYQLDYIQNYEGNSYVNIHGGRIGITGKDYMGPFNANGYPYVIENNEVIVLNPDALNPDAEGLTEDEIKEIKKQIKDQKQKIKDARLDNGDVFGGGKGFAGDRYEYAFCANVQNTHVTINYTNSSATPETYKNKSGGDKISNYTYANDCVSGAVYGGGENGHVMGNTEVNLINGLVGHAIYGGGNGKGQFTKTLYLIGSTTETHPVDIYSITAGKVYGNTKVRMEGGYVVRNIYGGGNMGSVGKGTYAGGTDDYSYYDFLPIRLFNGYGEAIDDLLWTPSENFDPTLPIGSDNQPITMADYFLSSGKTEVTITGGQIGFVDEKPDDSMKDGLPYGNVFGGCRGESAPNIQEIPRYDYSPECYSGYVNETKVTIGNGQGNGPIIYGSVYGGGQDGHVRRDTKVTINNATIGLPYNTDNRQLLGTLTLSGENEPTEQDNALISSHNDVNDAQWLFRGNVFGAGSGIGQYKYDFNANNRNTVDTDHDEVEDDNETEIEEWNYHNPITGEETLMKEVDYSTSAGSVTRFTNVEINGGTIYRNVYGGGSQASVGPPKIPIRTDDDPYRKGDTQSGHGVGKQTLNEVIINGGTIGSTNSRTTDYGGNVYGASRGNAELLGLGFSTSVWTTVEANSGHIYGNIFGGGEAGSVTRDTKVIIGGATQNQSGSGAPLRPIPAATQPNAVAPAVNINNSGNSNTSTPANVATEAPDARSIRTNRANQ